MTTTTQTNRDKILERIANLRARAEDDGSSESEAMFALKRANDMMEAYEVSEVELALAEEEGRITIEVVQRRVSSRIRNGNQRHKVQLALYGIEQFTATKVVIHNGWSDDELTWVGDKPDVEMAIYLVEMISHALDQEYERWKRTQLGVGRGAKASFQTAMAYRISSRLQDMAREKQTERRRAAEEARALPDASKSTALVLVDAMEAKEEEVLTTFKAAFPKLGKARIGGSMNNGNAYNAGRQAGDRVNFGRPVGGSASRAALA